VIGVTSLTVNPAGTKVSSAFNWNVVKRFASGATTEAVSVPVGGQATVSYQIVVTKTLTSQQVAVAVSVPGYVLAAPGLQSSGSCCSPHCSATL
jgi:hypothetical protein